MASPFKAIYQAPTAPATKTALDKFEKSEFGSRYLGVARIWRSAWDRVITFFAFSPAIRKLLYTTNAIESLNRPIRKVIKTKGSFGNDDSARKLVWLTLRRVAQKVKAPFAILSSSNGRDVGDVRETFYSTLKLIVNPFEISETQNFRYSIKKENHLLV